MTIITSQTLAAIIVIRCESLADGLKLYQELDCSHDRLISSLDMKFERLRSDWQTFLHKRTEEIKRQA